MACPGNATEFAGHGIDYISSRMPTRHLCSPVVRPVHFAACLASRSEGGKDVGIDGMERPREELDTGSEISVNRIDYRANGNQHSAFSFEHPCVLSTFDIQVFRWCPLTHPPSAVHTRGSTHFASCGAWGKA
jgi:hypothetical protein